MYQQPHQQQQQQYGQPAGSPYQQNSGQYENMGSPAAFTSHSSQQQQAQQGYFSGQQGQDVTAQLEQMSIQSPPLPSTQRSNKRSARAYHADHDVATLAAQHQPNMPPLPQQFSQSQFEQPQRDPRYAQVDNQTQQGTSHPANQPYQHPQQQQQQQSRQNGGGRIDVDQIPSPITVQDANQYKLDTESEGVYYTCSRMEVPHSTTQYTAVDQGNATPRFIRMTTYALPTTDDLAQAAQIPIGMIIQPFAKPAPGEEEVQCVDFGEMGPPRCKDCRAYINPWCVFMEGGQKFACNLCGSVTEGMSQLVASRASCSIVINIVTPEYFCHLDTSGRRLDLDQRLELQRGSIDFAVPKEYWVQLPSSTPSLSVTAPSTPSLLNKSDPLQKANLPVAGSRTPEPLCYIFAIDVSWTAAQCGMIREVAAGIRDIFYGAEDEDGNRNGGSLSPGARVGIITFDRTVHFYNLQVR